jgi:hypothetical protein
MGRKGSWMTPEEKEYLEEKKKREEEILSEMNEKSDVKEEVAYEPLIVETDKPIEDEFGVQPVGLDKVSTTTRLLDKNYSPLIVRKYMSFGRGWPLFVGLICDVSLSNLDHVVHQFSEGFGPVKDDIQWARNFCGGLSDHIVKTYEAVKPGCVEGVAVLWYVDKCFISSLYGDFMVHASCKQELFFIIQTLPHI